MMMRIITPPTTSINCSIKYENLLETSAVVDLESDDAFEVGGNMLSKIIGRVNLWVDSASISDCNKSLVETLNQ